jgi:hypothetical protein
MDGHCHEEHEVPALPKHFVFLLPNFDGKKRALKHIFFIGDIYENSHTAHRSEQGRPSVTQKR